MPDNHHELTQTAETDSEMFEAIQELLSQGFVLHNISDRKVRVFTFEKGSDG